MLRLAYRGTAYAGWQRQPNALSVEEATDSALSTILGTPIKLVGCGRTDTGVHASDYYAHFEYSGTFPEAFLRRLNRFLPDDIAIRELYQVPDNIHARFSASDRTYQYQITTEKDPFRTDTITHLPRADAYDKQLMQEAAKLILNYEEFATFCKTNSDAFTMRCTLHHSDWVFNKESWTYRIGANRFLRGMVRLIVGMCLRVGEGKLSLEQVQTALEKQERLPKPWSAPAAGLYLSGISYPDKNNWERIM
jgi:tRNA pseudouridine38-40 synthase